MGKLLKIHPTLLSIWQSLQRSRLGLYRYQGTEGDVVILQELITDRVVPCWVPSEHIGTKGELWLGRLVDSPLPGSAEAIMMITPYVLLAPGEAEWLAFFDRTLAGSNMGSVEAYENLMRRGQGRHYWNEFVFEAYARHNLGAIFLIGLPDVEESRPHSKANY